MLSSNCYFVENIYFVQTQDAALTCMKFLLWHNFTTCSASIKISSHAQQMITFTQLHSFPTAVIMVDHNSTENLLWMKEQCDWECYIKKGCLAAIHSIWQHMPHPLLLAERKKSLKAKLLVSPNGWNSSHKWYCWDCCCILYISMRSTRTAHIKFSNVMASDF
jgi:hypothetical protein